MTDHETRLKRLRLRSWRRGTKEMDLILGGFADDRLGGLGADALDRYEAMLSENDQDLYVWVSGQGSPPDTLAPMIAELRDYVERTRGVSKPASN